MWLDIRGAPGCGLPEAHGAATLRYKKLDHTDLWPDPVGLIFFIFFFPKKGIIGDPVQNLHLVNGLRGASVLLHLNESFEQLVSEIEWTFQTETSGAHLVAEFRNGQWKRFNSSFGTRLEPVEKTVLKIRDLEAEDGGVYEAQVTLRTALRTEDKDQVKLRIEEHTFRLVIYGK